MDIRHLARVDLNLLLTLQILLEEESVSRSADKLFLTQPAISKSLARLRDIFEDPLFTRSGRGLVPTPFALALREPLATILGEVEDLFVPETFDPASYKGNFIIAVNELLDMALMPALVEQLSRVAPGIHLKTLTQVDNQLQGLENGDLDFVLNLRFSEIPPGFQLDLLIRDRPEIFVRKGHPLLKKKKLTIEDMTEFPRVALNMPDMNKLSLFAMETAVTTRSRWQSPFETENLITALEVISRTDYLLPGPGLLNHFSTKDLVFTSLPFSQGPALNIEYCLVSHERVENSAVHQWLRNKIGEIARQVKL